MAVTAAAGVLMHYSIARHFPVIACATLLACACSPQPPPPAASGPPTAAAAAPMPAHAPTPGPTLADWARGAQLFDDLGGYSRKITTGSAAAQAWFDQGLRLIYAFALGQGAPLDSGSVYTVCRLLIRHHHSRGIAGCVQPVCVEWGKASLAFALKDEPEVRRGERLVSYGAPYAVCEPYRTPIQRGWKPRYPLK